MRVIEPGHKYALSVYASNAEGLLDPIPTTAGYGYDPASEQIITFISKLAGKDVHPGTTNEEIIKMLSDRMRFLDSKFPCMENKKAIDCIEEAGKWLEVRTQRRQKQGVEGKDLPHVSEPA